MSIYMFAPSPDMATKETNFATWEGGFSEAQLDEICRIGDLYAQDDATIESGSVVEKIRKSQVAWLGQNNQTNFIYDSMAYITRMLNGEFFGFDLYGFVEDFQYTVYRPEGDHYTWHIDKGMIRSAPRKLSLVLQLSDPNEYEGGDLEFYTGTEPFIAQKQRGLVYAFPSWLLHRVTPVTRGTRKSLVIWVSGPKFR